LRRRPVAQAAKKRYISVMYRLNQAPALFLTPSLLLAGLLLRP
jgi:hypothetical protein